MLDNITKKNIDDCRDVLVGKVPDPKSQIEQITLALIYKFMDDMDKEAVEKFKGKPKFFTGEYSKYGWRKLFDPSLSGADMLSLYSEALEKLNTNPNIPELFRNIFKNAYLPYRDPSTLKLFLKYINEFEYSHSEKLGDAFEYLLSVMGSQGDAGQFRTPRHIIDFVTACVDPQKGETILDPACGTSGFLLSAYKHILQQNTDKRIGDKLKPDDRKKLYSNIFGYDISPDMVRLSLANMYLHGFPTPHIYEYDTLSSEERWNDTFDVVLANPPFMTPKGGIRPHKKFGVQANKAEVLFTNYIAEHLNSNGRAGIVVPNGIVATTQTAYKELRKLLVEDSLIAVISLPAGCFNPYSGVKTSILILDKKLAKKSDSILFIKIENDGFDLGAQRRQQDKSDLPEALEILNKYKKVLTDQTEGDFSYSHVGHLINKNNILSNKDVVLIADRYKESKKVKSEFELVKISNLCNLVRGSSPRPQGDPVYYGGSIPRLMIADVTRDGKYTKPQIDFLTEKGALKSRPMNKGDVIMAVSGNPGLTTILAVDACIHDGFVGFKDLKETVLPEYFYYVLHHVKDENNSKADGATFRNLTTDQIKDFEIPVPSLEIQQQILSEIENYQKIIDGAKQIVDNYKPIIKIRPEWDMVELGEVTTITDGSHFSPSTTINGYPYITVRDISDSNIDLIHSKKISEQDYVSLKKSGCKPNKGDILFSKDGTVGKVALVETDVDFVVLSSLAIIKPNNEIISSLFLSNILSTDFVLAQALNLKGGVAIKRVVLRDLKTIKIPIIDICEQETINQQITEEKKLIDSTKKLIYIYEQKIKNKINEVWGVEENEEETKTVAFTPVNNDEYKRTVLATEIISKLHKEPTLGHVKLQKLIYLCQKTTSMQLATNFLRQAMGPYDPEMMRSIDKQLKEKEWFEYKQSETLKYRPLENAGQHKEDFERYFAEEKEAIYELLRKFKSATSETIEIVATLYACLDEILENKEIYSDASLMKRFYEWSDQKAKFEEKEVKALLVKMIESGIVPAKFKALV